MSLIGKGASSLRKQDVMEQKGIALGFKKVRFAHKATLGDTGINLNSLVLPPEMSQYGFQNPTAAQVASGKLMFFRNNLKLHSSLKGLLVDQLSYVVSSNTQITFLDFTAEAGEIFTGWLDETPTTSLTVVDGQQIIASGTLLAGQTDFNIGTPIEINKYSSAQHGAVMVYADRALQYRKAGNITSGDGDYIEVPVAGGLGSLIRFNASAVDRYITVISNGIVAERPDGSMMAAIERTQGQIDAMIPTLADLAGVDETDFQSAPNSVDLKQFGDMVLNHEVRLDTAEPTLAALAAIEATPFIALESSTIHNTLGAAAEYPHVVATLTPGTWWVSIGASIQTPTAGDSYARLSLSIQGSNANVAGTVGPSEWLAQPAGNDRVRGFSHSFPLVVGATTNYVLRGQIDNVGFNIEFGEPAGTVGGLQFIRAVKIKD